jgi:uncharacterized protein (TIGR03435 family)
VTHRLAAAVVALISAAAVMEPAGQVPAPAFEVASIKPNKSGDNRVLIQLPANGTLTATGITLRALIAFAYGEGRTLEDFRIIGGPDWIGSDRFDIVAKAGSDVPPGPNGPLSGMLRGLIDDRFKLVVHHEMRELPIFALVKAKKDDTLGPKLTHSTVDCAAMAAARGRGGPPVGPGVPPQRPPLEAAGRPMCGMMNGPGNIFAGGQTLAQIATMLSGRVGRVVIDRTGLTGTFDVELSWTPDQMPQTPAGPPRQGGPPFPSIDPNGPSIFTAVQEQLGLKLEATRGPVDVVVIDAVEHPTED